MYTLSWTNKVETIEFLLDNGANIDETSKKGLKAIDHAFKSGYRDYELKQILDLLIEHGAEYSPKTLSVALEEKPDYYMFVHDILVTLKESGQTVEIDKALEATILGDNEKLKQYIEGNQIPKKDLELIANYCAAFGNKENLNSLIDMGIELKEKTGTCSKRTLIQAAAVGNNMETAKYLIDDKKVEINWTKPDETPLYCATIISQ